jgi:2-polyprenyl-6-methoxyphenol hydroxylase-like FAD-dependent oxidoreductase
METEMDAALTLERSRSPAPPVEAAVIRTDVAIVGGGLAGSLAAAMLGRQGIDAVLIDPRSEYPPDFRCEKLDGDQVAVLRKTGLADAVLQAATPDRESWVARYGRVIDKRPGDQHGIYYDTLVNTVRAQIPPNIRFIKAKAVAISNGTQRQTITLSTDDGVSARLAVLANGLNLGVRDSLNLKREIISTCHSITIGFDMKPGPGGQFRFPALTFYAERPGDKAALITFFPIGNVMRANLFVYRTMDDPWLQEFRAAPQKTLLALMPGLHRYLDGFVVEGPVKIRPIDLYVTLGHLQPGIVLVGDAFSTGCPAAGTGARKVLNDVERLCNVHIPQWLRTPGMGCDKIEAFYSDPVKVASDRLSYDKAFGLRAFSTDARLRWKFRRRAKFIAQYLWSVLRTVARRCAFTVPATPTKSHPEVLPVVK